MGPYAVKEAGAQRASAEAPIQKEAIDIAKRMNPNVKLHVERVRNTPQGGRGKWCTPLVFSPCYILWSTTNANL